jgi:hypothetical protein
VPCFGRVTLLRWLMRIWRCREPACPADTFSEAHEQAPPRMALTVRAVRWAADALSYDDTTVSALARHLGVDWHTCWDAIEVEARARAAAPNRLAGVKTLGVDEHIVRHEALLFRMEVRDLRRFLKAGVMTTTGDQDETLTGTPQGGILSPLLANIALSTLDDHFARRWNETMGTANLRAQRRYHGEPTYRLIRYAEDFVVVVKGEECHAEQLREEVAAVLAPIGLRLSPAKTRVVHIDDGFDFLGFHIAGCGNAEATSCSSTPSRRRRRSPPSKAECGP